jgi:hypothetical protein
MIIQQRLSETHYNYKLNKETNQIEVSIDVDGLLDFDNSDKLVDILLEIEEQENECNKA